MFLVFLKITMPTAAPAGALPRRPQLPAIKNTGNLPRRDPTRRRADPRRGWEGSFHF